MLKRIVITTAFLLALIVRVFQAGAQPPSSSVPSNDPWSATELIAPSTLADEIKSGHAPIIFNIGVVEDIKTARHIGPVGEPANMKKFKLALAGLKKDETVVIYCGCCALPRCPNVRPAYKALKAAGFTHIRVLNLPTNLKTNWTAAGYPQEEK